MANKKRNKRAGAEQIAERAKPKWKAVSYRTAADAPTAPADAAVPDLDALHKKYFGRSAAKTAKSSRKAQMVVMEPKTPADTRVGRKTVVVEGTKVTGEQG